MRLSAPSIGDHDLGGMFLTALGEGAVSAWNMLVANPLLLALLASVLTASVYMQLRPRSRRRMSRR